MHNNYKQGIVRLRLPTPVIGVRLIVPQLKITKLDAVRAQLDAAIEMFFLSENTIATHTLVAAAYNALKDIAKKQGAEHPFLKTGYIQSLPESQRANTHKWLNEAENFFKHADRDPEEQLTFNPELTELLLIDACAYFRSGEIERPRHYEALIVWTGNIKEDIPKDSSHYALVNLLREALKSKGKKEFWVLFTQLMGKRRGA